MTKAKNIVYANGMKFSCGPPIRAGAYDNWNWCKQCTAIWDKKTKRCETCHQSIRQSARAHRMSRLDWGK